MNEFTIIIFEIYVCELQKELYVEPKLFFFGRFTNKSEIKLLLAKFMFAQSDVIYCVNIIKKNIVLKFSPILS